MTSVAQQTPAQAIQDLRVALASVDSTATADRVLRAQAGALMRALGRLPVAILVANNHARYVEANRAATLLTGYSRHELLERSVWDITPPALRSDGRRQWDAFLKRGELSGRYTLKPKAGRMIRASFFAAANVLPGLHVSALTTASLIARLRPRAKRARTARRST
jgi:PAS domain S-box-containing protein